jgi:hypothetical protein
MSAVRDEVNLRCSCPNGCFTFEGRGKGFGPGQAAFDDLSALFGHHSRLGRCGTLRKNADRLARASAIRAPQHRLGDPSRRG